MQKRILYLIITVSSALPCLLQAQSVNPYKPDSHAPKKIPGYTLSWNDEFNRDGNPDPGNWTYESGFVRNYELQWYQQQNAICKNGVLRIEARREKMENPNYNKEDTGNWRRNRPFIEYTSSSLKTSGLQQWVFGRFEIRARIDTAKGSWPAIWTLGSGGRWPLGGEVDIMEFYRPKGIPTILANMAWGRSQNGGAIWNTKEIPLQHFTANDKEWVKKFHVWRMDWTKDSISLYLDDELLNTIALSKTLNPDESNPFLKPQYLLLNLAIGANGGDPSLTKFPIIYEVDYVRVYQQAK